MSNELFDEYVAGDQDREDVFEYDYYVHPENYDGNDELVAGDQTRVDTEFDTYDAGDQDRVDEEYDTYERAIATV